MPEHDNYFTLGYMDYPQKLHFPIHAAAQVQYGRGWSSAQRHEQASDKEFDFGRDTYFANYDEPVGKTT